MRKCLTLFLIVIFLNSLEAKVPDLSPKDTHAKIEEILKAHVSHQKLTPELLNRAFHNYLEQLDPSKTYLLTSEIEKWTEPSEALLQKALEAYQKDDFSHFSDIHSVMLKAIERRNDLEKELVSSELPKQVQTSEFKDQPWAKNRNELKERLLKLKSLQLEAAQKLNPDTKGQFLQRIEKYRLNHEKELVGQNHKDQEKIVLTYVLKAISSALDSQTVYFTPGEASQFMMQVQQRLFGIGAQLRDDLNGLTITRLLDGGPAIADGKLKIGDKIIAVNNEPIIGMEISEAVELIRGPQGTSLTLTILRKKDEAPDEDKVDIQITRGEVVLKESRYEVFQEPFGNGVIGILHLFSFYQDAKSSSASDLAQAIEDLKKLKLQGLILDLRNNAGGLLTQAVAVSGLFMNKGVVVSVKDNTGAVQHLRNIESKMAWDGPLIILTNRGSASASEIVAQALQDYGRAIVVGDAETFGKGTFQTFTLEAHNFGKVNPKGEYKVTRGRYYTVSGKSPQLIGVKADIDVPGILSQLEVGEKFCKYPVESDQIPSQFNDDLSDIPTYYRNQVARTYKANLQPILTTYTDYLPLLQKNAAQRIKLNKNYQNFLSEISKKDHNLDIESFGQADLQLGETVNLMKDLILLSGQKNISINS